MHEWALFTTSDVLEITLQETRDVLNWNAPTKQDFGRRSWHWPMSMPWTARRDHLLYLAVRYATEGCKQRGKQSRRVPGVRFSEGTVSAASHNANRELMKHEDTSCNNLT